VILEFDFGLLLGFLFIALRDQLVVLRRGKDRRKSVRGREEVER
jgi:hypothetical protein